MTDQAKLVAEWTWVNNRYRLVHTAGRFVVERCDRNTPGLELWTPVLDTRGLRDGGSAIMLCHAIEQVAKSGLKPNERHG